jgi:hypothetical protein
MDRRKHAEEELNALYQKQINRLHSEKNKARLEDAQRAWVASAISRAFTRWGLEKNLAPFGQRCDQAASLTI